MYLKGLHCFVNIFYMEELFRNEEYHTWNNGIPLRYSLSALLFAVTIALSFLARHVRLILIKRKDRSYVFSFVYLIYV